MSGRVVFEVGNTWVQVHGADDTITRIMDLESRYATDQAALIAQAAKVALYQGDADKKSGWDGWIRLFRKRIQSPDYFPTGLLSRLERIVKKHRYGVTINDTRERPDFGMPEMIGGDTIVDRDYQLAACAAAEREGRGVLDMPPRCHALGETVLMADGRTRMVDNIKVGDRLLGPDGSPRAVIEVHRGTDELFRVVPSKWAKPFVVNSEHLLVIRRNKRLWRRFEWEDTLVSARDYAQKTKNWKRRTYLRFSDPVEFPDAEEPDLPLDPYFLGLLLGDGYLRESPELTSVDVELQECAVDHGTRLGLRACRVVYPKDRAPKVVFTNGRYATRSTPNPLTEIMRSLGLLGKKSGTKFIPDIYLRSSISARRALLAGLLDTDGYLAGGTYFEYVSKSRDLARGVRFIGNSLGLRVSQTEKVVDGQAYQRLNLCGDTSSIPTRLPRKVSRHKGRDQDTRSSFTVESKGPGEFVGFTVDGDHQYLDGQFITQHNSGKTRTMCEIHRRISLPTIWIAPTDRICTQTQQVLEGFFGSNYSMQLVGSKDEAKAAKMKVVVCTNATAARLSPEFYKTREMVAVDEWHHGASKTFSKEIFPKLDHCYYRFGMTGTFFRSGDDAMAMHALLSNTIYKVESSMLLERGFLVPTKVAYLPIPRKPMLRGVPKNFVTGHGKFGIHEHTHRNQLAGWAAASCHKMGRKTIVLVGTKRQGRAIQRYVEAFLPDKGTGQEFSPVEFVSTDKDRGHQGKILDAFLNTSEVNVLIGTSLLGEGVDLPNVDALVYARGEKAEVSLKQNAYRVCTAIPGKKDAIIVDFADRHHSKLLKHSHDRLNVYYQEPTFSVEVLSDANHFASWLAAGQVDSGRI